MDNSPTPNQSEFLLYVSQGGDIKVDVVLYDETVWLTQKGMQELFDKDKRTISEHIRNVFDEGELDSEATVRNFRTVRLEGNRKVARELDFYNLDALVSGEVKKIKGRS